MDSLENETAIDENKPLNSLEDAHDDDSQSDPDEILHLPPSKLTSGQLWHIKLPKFLMERWTAIDEGGQLLGTLRVWNEKDPRTGKQFMSIFVPSEKDPSVLEEFKLDMVRENVINQYVIASVDKDPKDPTNRAKSTRYFGRVRHEANVRPKYNADYSGRMRARAAAASQPVRQIKMIEKSMSGGNINMLSSGITFDSLARTSKGHPSQNTERFIRLPRNLLFDQLFQLFSEKRCWSVKELRSRTEQPETYLREILPQIAMQHKIGSQYGLWELLKSYREKLNIENDSAVTNVDIDDEDSDDDEMEEI